MNRFLSAAVCALALLCLGNALVQASPTPPTSCIWHADGQSLYQIAVDSNQLTQTIPLAKAGSLAMNASDCGVWAVADKQLYHFDADGTQTLAINLQSLNKKLTNTTQANVDPYDDSLWLFDHKTVVHIDDQGQLLASWTVPSNLTSPMADLHNMQHPMMVERNNNLTSLTVDLDQSLWLFDNKHLSHYSAQGALLASLDLNPLVPTNPSAVAYDRLDQILWVAGEKKLTELRLDPFPPEQAALQITLPETVNAITVDPLAGEVWIATNNSLLSYGRDGTPGPTVDLTAFGLSNPSELAFDATSRTLWVASAKGLIHFNLQGAELAGWSADQERAKLTGWSADQVGAALAVPPFLMQPTLSLVRPPSDGLTNDPMPTISYLYGAQCNGQPCGFTPNAFADYTLSAQLNQAAISPFTFEPLTGEANYEPTARLPEGQNTLTAQATDPYGHKSNVTNDSFTIDTIPPHFLSLSPADGTLTNQPATDLQGVVDDPTATVILDSVGAAQNTSIANGTLHFDFPVTLKEGANTFDLSAWDLANNHSTAQLHLTLDTIPPKFVSITPADGSQFSTPQITISGSVDDPEAKVTLENLAQWNGTGTNPAGQDFSWTLTLKPGANDITLSAVDQAGNVATKKLTLTFTPPPPPAPVVAKIAVGTPSGGSVAVTGDSGAVSPGYAVTVTDVTSGQTQTATADSTGAFSLTIAASAGDTLSITDTDAWGDTSPAVQLTVSTGLPPDPNTVAPPNDPTVPTQMAASTAFLYTGANPIQTGVVAGTIDSKRVTVIRGKVMTRDGQPLPGVTITVHDHPEFGQTESRADGKFDLAANGGGDLTLDYQMTGYLPVQRTVQTPWQDYVIAPDVAMTPLDSQVTPVNLTGGAAAQVARGSVVTDSDGTRQATLIFPAGTTATMTLPDGTTQPLTSAHIRATEYTVGSNGLDAMPGDLPPQSAYTYAVALTTDEAIAAGATQVSFSQPVASYTDNFLNFPVGTLVPAGWYDPQKAAWVPSANGLVIKILSVTNGLADIDVDGSGTAADASTLSSLGITDAERAQLATLYAPGKTLWRVPVSHFTDWDYNWGWGPPKDATPPNVDDPHTDAPPNNPCTKHGSIVECESQVLGETIPISGTPFHLNYRSDRVLGRINEDSITIPLSGAAVPSDLQGITLVVDVAGQEFTKSFGPLPNQSYSFTWNGLDGYGRQVQGQQTAAIRIGYVYNGTYLIYSYGSTYDAIFGHFGYFGAPATGNRTRHQITLWQVQTVKLASWDARAWGVGAWTFDPHDFLGGTILYKGDGTRLDTHPLGTGIIDTVAGNGTSGFSGDGGPATQAELAEPQGVAVGPDGSLYIADSSNGRLRKVSPDGIITTLWGFSVYYNLPEGVAVGPDGSVYIADDDYERIWKLSPDGTTITSVAGDGHYGYYGDGGPAYNAALFNPHGIVLAPDGSLYIADTENNRIRKVSPDGIITTVAGDGTSGFSGDGGPATQAELAEPQGVAVGPDGSLYIADAYNNRIRKVSPDGIITTVAGTGGWGFSGDGGSAAQGELAEPQGVAVGADGSLYIADDGNRCIRMVSSNGTITTVAGTGAQGFGGDGGPAAQAYFDSPWGVAVGADGSLYIADFGNNRIRRIRFALANHVVTGGSIVPSADGHAVYEFDLSGRHVETLDATTGAVRYRFQYDSGGYLTAIVDGDGNTTTIERDSAENPTAIVAPNGQRTTLIVDANGYLASVTDPNGHTYDMTYTSDGLLTGFTDPNSHASSFSYDSNGLLLTDRNAAGGGWTLARSELTDGYQVSVTSGERRTNTQKVETLSTGGQLRTTIAEDGAVTTTKMDTNGMTTVNEADGTVTTRQDGPDPRFGMDSPVPTKVAVTTPAGLTETLTTTRTASLSNLADPLSATALTETVTDNGRASTMNYEAATHTETLTTPAGRKLTDLLDSHGRVASETPGNLATTAYSYNAQGRLADLTVGGERSYTLGYDSAGNLASITDPLSRVTTFGYDPAGRLTSETLPGGATIQYGYDAKGNLTSIVPPGRSAHVFSYTAVDQTQDYTPPALGGVDTITHYSYDKDRNLTQITRPDGSTVNLTYDSGNHLKTLTDPQAGYDYGYNAAGQLTGITRSDGNGLSYDYDGFLPLSETESGSVSGSVSLTYDNNFRVTQQCVSGGNCVAYGYDDDGLITQAGDLALSRDAQNGLSTGTTLGDVQTGNSYDAFGELKDATASINGNPVLSTAYSYDQLGRITEKQETESGVTTTYDYSYDTAGRLATVTTNGTLTATYTYDDNGNRLSKVTPQGTESGTYDAQDRMLSYGGASYTYTDNGDLLTKSVGNEMTVYSYDALGNLTEVKLPGGDTIDYLIDGRNRRIGKEVNGTLVEGFLYQNQINPVAQLDGSGNVVARFVYGSKVNVPDYMVKGGVTYRIVSDHLGSPRLVIDTSNGQVVQEMKYDAFGNVIEDTNPGFQPFGFAGGLYDSQTGLVRFGARDYDPGTGRWTSKDPILFRGGSSDLYAYVLDEPINLVDPYGLSLCSILHLLGKYSFDISGGVGEGLGILGGLSFSSSGISGSITAGSGIGLGGNVSISKTNDISPISSTSGIGTAVSVSGGSVIGGAVTLSAGTGGVSVTREIGIGFGFDITSGFHAYGQLVNCSGCNS